MCSSLSKNCKKPSLSGTDRRNTISTRNEVAGREGCGWNRDADTTNESAFWFYSLGMNLMLKDLKPSIRSHTLCTYVFKRPLLTTYILLTWLMMSSESPMTMRSRTCISWANNNPWTRASYSATLLVHSNYDLKEWGSISRVRLSKTTPAPDPDFAHAPSNIIFQHPSKGGSRSGSSTV